MKLCLSLPDLRVHGWFGIPKGSTWWADAKKKSLTQDNVMCAPSSGLQMPNTPSSPSTDSLQETTWPQFPLPPVGSGPPLVLRTNQN